MRILLLEFTVETIKKLNKHSKIRHKNSLLRFVCNIYCFSWIGTNSFNSVRVRRIDILWTCQLDVRKFISMK